MAGAVFEAGTAGLLKGLAGPLVGAIARDPGGTDAGATAGRGAGVELDIPALGLTVDGSSTEVVFRVAGGPATDEAAAVCGRDPASPGTMCCGLWGGRWGRRARGLTPLSVAEGRALEDVRA